VLTRRSMRKFKKRVKEEEGGRKIGTDISWVITGTGGIKEGGGDPPFPARAPAGDRVASEPKKKSGTRLARRDDGRKKRAETPGRGFGKIENLLSGNATRERGEIATGVTRDSDEKESECPRFT